MVEVFDKKNFFKKITGKWEGVARTYFKPEELADTSPIKGTIKEVVDGLFLLHEYEGKLMGKKMVGLTICGYNENKNQFEIAWIDNQHLGSEIMFLTGNNISNTFSALGHYSSADKSQIWSWRTIFQLKNPNNLVIQHFNITPEGLEYIGVEIDYKRA